MARRMGITAYSILARAAVLGVLAVSAAAPAQSVKAGIEAWQRGENAAAVAIWKPLAEQGDADAAFNLGQAYRLGRGVPIDLAAAQSWLTRAAEKGHLDAQATLGLLLFQSGNRAGALRWLKAAAERGEPRASLVYGTALFNGDGVQRDFVLAYALVSRAAAQGLGAAKATLAEMDKLIPLDKRRKGVALALEKVGAEPPTAKPKPDAKPAPKVAADKPKAPAAGEAPAKSAVPSSGGWRVQLGAFGRKSAAEALFAKLSGSGELAGRQPSYIAAGAVTRLQVGPFESKAKAQAACAALARRGQACFAVLAK